MALPKYEPQAYELLAWCVENWPQSGQPVLHGPIPEHLKPWVAYCQREGLMAAVPMLMVTEWGRLVLQEWAAAERSGETDASEPPARGVSATAIEALLGDASREILKIARSDLTADEKMRGIVRADRRYLAWESPQWAELLGVSDAAIRKTHFWKSDRQGAIERGCLSQ